jgi:hypothetical protein
VKGNQPGIFLKTSCPNIGLRLAVMHGGRRKKFRGEEDETAVNKSK